MKVVHAAGFIHRDIKPANIFLRVDGDPVLLDFGSARTSLGQGEQSLTSIFSRGYAPIEQYHSSEEMQGAWTDIYALGATMYRAISGIPPTDAVDRSAAIAQIEHDTYVSITEIAGDDYSEDFLKAIDYALQFRQQDRPQSMSEWASTFDRRDISMRNQFAADAPILEEKITAAESGDVSAQSELAFMYAKGINAEKDERTAVRWYREAAENNHLNAQYNLALLYAKGRGVEQNYNEALKWYELAAAQGDKNSQYTLGVMYSKGVGTDKDYEHAFKWFLKAAEQENTNAEYKVAEMYNKGIGVEVDLTAAHEWYTKASIKDHTLAQMKLAYTYGKGHGVERNDIEAYHWFRKAAEQGHPKAQYNLGVIYAKGRGITKNIDEAKKWYERAAAQGDEHAEKALSKLTN